MSREVQCREHDSEDGPCMTRHSIKAVNAKITLTTLVLLVVDTVPNIPVVPDNVDMPVICPAICKLETDKVLVVLFHAKFGDCKIDYFKESFCANGIHQWRATSSQPSINLA